MSTCPTLAKRYLSSIMCSMEVCVLCHCTLNINGTNDSVSPIFYRCSYEAQNQQMAYYSLQNDIEHEPSLCLHLGHLPNPSYELERCPQCPYTKNSTSHHYQSTLWATTMFILLIRIISLCTFLGFPHLDNHIV